MIPDSFVSLVAPDGRLLVIYGPGRGSFEPPIRRVSPHSLEAVRGRRSGVFLSVPSRYGYVGFARSAALPLYVGASVPIASLRGGMAPAGRGRLGEIRPLGIRLSIDDFGTGYASLAYLKQLPVRTLKIDRTFITNLVQDAADQKIVRSSVQLAHGFGMTVVAEGVETAETARELQSYGCEFAQGYYFGHPQTAAEIEAQWLKTSGDASARSARGAAPAVVP